MESKITFYAAFESEKNIKDNILIKRLYISPQIIRLNDINIQTGTTTNLVESSNGAWQAGS